MTSILAKHTVIILPGVILNHNSMGHSLALPAHDTLDVLGYASEPPV